MKFYHFALIGALVLIPLASGKPPHHHGSVPPSALRRQRRRVKDTKTKPPKDGTTKVAKAECETEHPLPKLEKGCPCFNLETIKSQMDYGKSEYCEFYESLPEDDPCNHSSWEYMDLYASSPEEELGGDPPTFQGSYVSFSINKDTDPDYGQTTCYASVDNSKHTGSYMYDMVAEENFEDVGESHWYYIAVGVTEDEYKDCADILSKFKDQLPDNCMIGDDGGWW